MKKIFFAIAIILVALNCMGQRYHTYISPRHYYGHYSSPRYYSTYHHSYSYSGGGYYSSSQTNKENYYDWTTYNCVNPNEIDSIIFFDGEEYEMFVYPQGRSFDTKSYWNNEPLDLPKWVKTMIYYDLCDGKKHTEFLISSRFTKYQGSKNTNISLQCLYNYRVVFKSKTHEYWYDIYGKGGSYKSIKLGDYNLWLRPEEISYFELTDEKSAVYELDESGLDQEDYNVIYNYLKENQERLGINVLSNGYDGGCLSHGISINYWLDEVWSDQAKQLYYLYDKQRRNSIN